MRMFGLLVISSLVACGGSKSADPTDDQLCKKMSGLCDSVEHLQCFTAKDWAEMQHDIGKDKTLKFRRCVGKANDCGALTGCAVELGLSLRGLAGKTHDQPADPDVDDKRRPIDHDIDDDDDDGAHAAVHYDSVTVRPSQDSFGYHLAVSIELTVEGGYAFHSHASDGRGVLRWQKRQERSVLFDALGGEEGREAQRHDQFVR